MNSKIAEQFSILKEKIDSLKKRNKELEAINLIKINEVNKLNLDIENLNKKIEDLSNENDNLQIEIKNLLVNLELLNSSKNNERSEDEIHHIVREIDYCIDKLKKIND